MTCYHSGMAGESKRILKTGDEIRALRERLHPGHGGLTRFAKRMGVSRMTAYRWEQNGVTWKRLAGMFDMLERDAEALERQ